MLVGDLLRRAAQRHPAKTALLMTDGSGSRSYTQLHERANRLANSLGALAAPETGSPSCPRTRWSSWRPTTASRRPAWH